MILTFVPALALGPVVEHSAQDAGAPWEIRVYPGADGRFTLYEDDGETYRYERGEHATTTLRWDDAGRTLHIDARQGRYPGLVARRTLNVRVMGAAGQAEQTRAVAYQGQAVELRFAASAP